MKKILIIALLMLFSVNAYSQQRAPESKPDFELTKDEATLRIQDWEQKIRELEGKLANLQGDVSENQKLLAMEKDCYQFIKGV